MSHAVFLVPLSCKKDVNSFASKFVNDAKAKGPTVLSITENQSLSDFSALSEKEAKELYAQNQSSVITEKAISLFLKHRQEKGLNIIMGLNHVLGGLTDFDLNLSLAQDLSANILFLVDTEGLSSVDAEERINNAIVLGKNKLEGFLGVLPVQNAAVTIKEKDFFFQNTSDVLNKLDKEDNLGMRFKMFEQILIEKASAKKRHIVLPEGNDERTLRAADDLARRNVVKLTILGDETQIKSDVTRLALNIGDAQIINPKTSNKREQYAKSLFEMRKSKGMTEEEALKLMDDETYYGTMMLKENDADGLVSGACHSTADTVRPALQLIKTVPGCSVVSSIFFMCLPNRTVIYGDCAINPNPTPAQVAEIAIASAETAISFGMEPKVALLSYSTGNSGVGPDVDHVKEAVRIAKETRPDLCIDGPIQYDAAVDPQVGQKKMPGSKVAGNANVLIFPELNAGNIGYKVAQREAKAEAIGPMLQGLNKPMNDLSRGCFVQDIVNTVFLTAIQVRD